MTADADGIIFVIYVTETESDTISAIQFMIKMITTSASKNLGIIVGPESLRDIFLRKIPETNIFISQAPWTSRATQNGGRFTI